MTVLAFAMLAFAALLLGVALANAVGWPRIAPAGQHFPGRVSVLVPARDEEAHLEACLATVLVQGPELLEALVYDDRSSDRTAEIVQDIAGRDPRVRLLSGGELPAGWYGKPHACQRLADAARGEWLLFLDADARLEQGALAALVGEAEGRRVTLLSAWPDLEMASFPERALMPMLNSFVFTLYPAPLALLRPEPALGLAHGACILVRADAYRRLGGHGRVACEIFEDTRLAREWRALGERSLCLDGRAIVRVRMYDSLAGIWRGFRKNLYAGFTSDTSFWAFQAFRAVAFLGPFVLAPTLSAIGHPAAQFAWIAVGLVLAQRLVLALRFGHPLWSCLLEPVAEVFLLVLAVASRRSARGGGVEWKGRRYTVRSRQGTRE